MGDGEAPGRWQTETWLPVVLLVVAAFGWGWTVLHAGTMQGESMSDGMSVDAASAMSFMAFLVAWVAMMAAMMLPAVLPVVRLYARAAATGNAAPVVVFVAGYLALWSVTGVPTFFAWSRLSGPLGQGDPSVGRFAGAVALAAGLYQLTPLKSTCLRHCRSPLSFFMHHGRHLDRPLGAFVAGSRHGLFCLGCCWMMMLLLIAFGTMQLAWMALLAVLILLEKVAPFGEALTRVAAGAFVFLGALLLVHPTLITHLV